MILDAGFLVSVDRDERAAKELLTAAVRHSTPLHTTELVLAQASADAGDISRLAAALRDHQPRVHRWP